MMAPPAGRLICATTNMSEAFLASSQLFVFGASVAASCPIEKALTPMRNFAFVMVCTSFVTLSANVSHGSPVVARVTTQNLQEAIELAFDKVEAQLRKHKEKVRDHRVREQAAAGAPAAAPDADEEAEETEAE